MPAESALKATTARPDVEVRRSARRRRTVSAYREGDRTIVLIPARMSAAEEKRWVARMLERLAAQEAKRVLGDDALERRARELSEQYLNGTAVPASVRWVTNQNSRWGSCTPAEGSIRLSHRLKGMPAWVVDYVLLHELAHLLVPGHGPRFWRLLDAYPRTERARGFLEGVVAAARLPHSPSPGQDSAADGEDPADGLSEDLPDDLSEEFGQVAEGEPGECD
ncbi:M48 metallopeptidase family protein [Allostreptomyces psammosilenae]|uniref:M48 metallopeptidase family protein n=1 Tax=Allostreptomyces psammosilenae TaxID=1892865 RepID=UPI0015C6E9DB|nr:M48 family metallopeptidase [Allostreptomyces psammosilenae]